MRIMVIVSVAALALSGCSSNSADELTARDSVFPVGDRAGPTAMATPTTATSGVPVVSTIPIGAEPNEIAFAPASTQSAGYGYVANTGDDTVSVIDPNGNPRGTIKAGDRPLGVAVAGPRLENSGEVYVTNFDDGTVSVLEDGQKVAATLEVGTAPVGVAVAPAGTPAAGNVYVTSSNTGSVSVFDQFDKPIMTVTVGSVTRSGPYAVAVAPAGTGNAGDVYVTHFDDGTVVVIDPVSNRIKQTVKVGYGAYGVAVAPAGVQRPGYLYVSRATANTVTAIDTTYTIAGTQDVPAGPYGIAVAGVGSGSSGSVFVPSRYGNVLTRILPGATSAETIAKVGSSPFAVAIPDAGTQRGNVVVSNLGSNSLSSVSSAAISLATGEGRGQQYFVAKGETTALSRGGTLYLWVTKPGAKPQVAGYASVTTGGVFDFHEAEPGNSVDATGTYLVSVTTSKDDSSSSISSAQYDNKPAG